jgi:hypothetical protein
MIYSGVSAEKYMSISNRTTTDGVDIYLEEWNNSIIDYKYVRNTIL